MRGAAWPLGIFATVMVLFGFMNRIWEDSTVQSATYAFAAGVIYLFIAGSLAVGGRQVLQRGAPSSEDRLRAIPAESLGAAVLGVGAAVLGFGFVFGTSMVIAGCGLLVAGGGLVGRELRAQRRARDGVIRESRG